MKKFFFMILVAGTVCGCAAMPSDPGERSDLLALNDPIEPANRARALSEFRRVLGPGGRLIIVTPSRRALNALAFVDNLLTLRGQRIMRLAFLRCERFAQSRGFAWLAILGALLGPAAFPAGFRGGISLTGR